MTTPHRSQAGLHPLIEGDRQTPATHPGRWSGLGAEQHYIIQYRPCRGLNHNVLACEVDRRAGAFALSDQSGRRQVLGPHLLNVFVKLEGI
jgi:hypothetical protein